MKRMMRPTRMRFVGQIEWVPELEVHVDRLFAKGQDQNLTTDLERNPMEYKDD
ncbi:hypothetical protein VF21_07247 [Pseudogymnoascus sp. 05NY08]|nr:hypothetical protein VF21_07247 [Pseudogymnoascus sp. 05NY08]